MSDGVYLKPDGKTTFRLENRGWHSDRFRLARDVLSGRTKGWRWFAASDVKGATFVLPLSFVKGADR